MSLTKKIVEETIKAVEEFYEKDFMKINGSKNTVGKSSMWKIKQIFIRLINGLLEKIGLHITSVGKLVDLERNQRIRGLQGFHSIRTVVDLLIFNRYKDYDYVFDNLADEVSKKTFERFIRARILEFFIGRHNAMDLLGYVEIIDEKCLNNLKQKLKTVNNVIYDSVLRLSFYDTFCQNQYYPDFLGISQGDVVIDVGSYLGDTAIYFAELGAKVFAFEPNPGTFQKLKEIIRKLELQNKVTILDFALGSIRDIVALTDADGASRISESGVRVRQITLDDFVEDYGLKRVDYIKADVEGSEMDVLKGSKKTIERFRPKIAVCVYHHDNDIVEIVKFIKERGYNLMMRGFRFDHEYVVFGIPK